MSTANGTKSRIHSGWVKSATFACTGTAVLAVSAVLMLSAEAQAAAARFVASNGNDASACTRAAPCRTLPRGVRVTPPGAELQILDSGLYGDPLTINKSITISADGVSATLGDVVINSAGALVTLRGLLFNGKNAGATGILITAAAAVHILDCTVERFASSGIQLARADTQLFVTDSVSRDNGDGLIILGERTTATLTVANSRFENNGNAGLDIRGIDSAITHSVASGNGAGIVQTGGTANIEWTTAASNDVGYHVTGSGEMTLEYSVAGGNNFGLFVDGSGDTARISGSVFTNNTTGIHNDTGGEVLTRRNNTVSGNTTDLGGAGTFTPLGGI